MTAKKTRADSAAAPAPKAEAPKPEPTLDVVLLAPRGRHRRGAILSLPKSEASEAIKQGGARKATEDDLGVRGAPPARD